MSIMKIAIDASRIVNQKGGITVYLKELLDHFHKIDQINEYLLYFVYLKDRGGNKKKQINRLDYFPHEKKIFRIPGKCKDILSRSFVPFPEIVIGKQDLFFAPTVLDLGYSSSIPTIVTIYDLTYFLFPDHLGKKVSQELQAKTRMACKKAQRILAISHNTKNDLINFLQVPEEKIIVTHLAADPAFTKKEKEECLIKKRMNLPESFFLFVGTISPRKNIGFLIDVYAQLSKEIRETYKLVIVGEKGWNYGEIFEKAAPFIERKEIYFLNFVNKKDLIEIYNLADLFLYPPLYEGFGIPLLEAMACGLPVIAAQNSSIQEIVESNGIVLPLDKEAWKKAIERLIANSTERDSLKKKGILHCKKFSWEKTAYETLEVFNQFAKGRV